MRHTKIVSVIVIALVSHLGFGADNGSGYRPLRSLDPKWPFPANEASLLRIRDDADSDKMRERAWALFAGLTTGNTPVWNTWFTKCDVGLSAKNCQTSQPNQQLRLIQQFEIPRQLIDQIVSAPHAKAEDFVNTFIQHPQFAAVLFNRQAANHIRKYKLSSPDELARLNLERNREKSPVAEREIAPFPREAVVIKTTWAVVYEDQAKREAGPLYIWTEESLRKTLARGPGTSAEFSDFDPSVVIDTTPHRPCDRLDYPQRVPLSCFYAYAITPEVYQALPVPPLLFTAGPGKAAYLILVGVHVTTKETPDWVWATFWWHNMAAQGPFAAGRPPTIHDRWRHFLMDTTLSADTPHSDGQRKTCFNPYLESHFRNGVVSNCLRCHSHAVYPQPPDNYAPGLPWIAATPIDPPGYFEQSLKLDFLWSLDSRDPTAVKSLEDIQLLLQTLLKSQAQSRQKR